MRTISIANQKGGCAKTTTAINLASALAMKMRRILLVDLDPQSHASFGLGVSVQVQDKTIYSVLTDNQERRRLISDCIVNVSQNLDIVPSNILLSTLEQELKDKEDAVSRLYQVISASPGLKYDYIIVDCPPSLGFLTFNALRAAEIVIVPIDMSAFSLMGVSKLLGMLELIKVKIAHAPGVYALATIFDRRTKYSEVMLADIRNLFKDQMLDTIIRMNVTLKKAAANGVPVTQYDPKSNGAADHIALADELLKKLGDSELERAIDSIAAEEAGKGAEAEPQGATVATIKVTQEVVVSKEIEPEPTAREIEFNLEAPNAREIYLVGDFNHWKIDDTSRLSRLQDGRWQRRMALSPGRYKYKFVVDGEWTIDPRNTNREVNSFGTFDSVLKI